MPCPATQVGEAPPARVRVGIISRRRKRFILNEHEMVEAILSLGYDVQLLPMEEMTLFEQVLCFFYLLSALFVSLVRVFFSAYLLHF